MNRGSFRDGDVSSLPRRERERLQRRADILRAAEQVFAAHGFHAASIEQIARTAEYATGTVYLYFRDKEALYLELFEEKIREVSELIRQRTEGVKDPVEALRQLVVARMEYFERNRAFFRMPEGGFFLWLETGNGVETAAMLWRSAGLRVVPGAFLANDGGIGRRGGNPGTNFIRLALVNAEETTRAALRRLARVLPGPGT